MNERSSIVYGAKRGESVRFFGLLSLMLRFCIRGFEMHFRGTHAEHPSCGRAATATTPVKRARLDRRNGANYCVQEAIIWLMCMRMCTTHAVEQPASHTERITMQFSKSKQDHVAVCPRAQADIAQRFSVTS